MATMSGSIAASSVYSGWRVYAKYTVSTSATQVTVSISEGGAYAVGSAVDFSFGSSQTFKMGSNTYTAQYYQGSWPEVSLREWITLCTNDSLSNYRTWTYTFNRGHTSTTKTINVSMTLGSGWYLTKNGTYKSVANTTSSGTISVTVPALESWTVTLDAQGGTGAASTLTKYYGEALALPQPVKDCYAFSHWTDGTTNYTTSYTANAAASLTAVYSPAISAAHITQLYAARDDGRFLWDSQTGKHTSASDDGEYVYIRAWWRVDGADAATISLGATMADTSTVWTGATRQVSKPGTGELYLEGVAEWGTTQTALATGQYDVTVTLSTGTGNPSDSRGTTVPTAFFTIDVLAGGHGIAFGKPATQAGVMDIGFDVQIDGKALGVWIVETGTNNGWSYEKRSDGTYRAKWSDDLALNAGSAWGGFYYHQQSTAINVPSFSTGFEVVGAVKNNSQLSFYVGRVASTTSLQGYWVNGNSGSATASTFGTVTYTIEGTY